MKERGLAPEIVTPDGTFLFEKRVEEVVVRRREKRFYPGSEIAIFPLHAPLLVRTQPCRIRYAKGGRLFRLRTGGGFLQVKDDRVLLVVAEPDPATGVFAKVA